MSISQIGHPHGPCTHMDVFWLRNIVTHLNWLNPSMSHHILNRWAMLGIRFQHLANEAATRPRIEVIDCRRAWRHGLIQTGTSCDIGRIELVSCWLRRAPRKFLEVQAVIDYPACPDIDQPRVIRYHHRRQVVSRMFSRCECWRVLGSNKWVEQMSGFSCL